MEGTEQKLVSREYLEKVNYNDYKKEFEKMGIGEFFVAGKKREFLVDLALQKQAERAEILNSKGAEASKEEVSAELKKKDEEAAKAKALKDAEEAEAKEKEEAKKKKEVKSAVSKLTKEQLINNIVSIERNLITPIPAQKAALYSKKYALMEELKDVHGIDWEKEKGK
ncbi:hypothetical protein [Tenacibaculum phage Larrie]|nr:hypothetical protein [Tenacibaculum phage Larrie]